MNEALTKGKVSFVEFKVIVGLSYNVGFKLKWVNLTKVFYLWRGQIWANFRKFLKPFRQIVLKITQPLNLAMK